MDAAARDLDARVDEHEEAGPGNFLAYPPLNILRSKLDEPVKVAIVGGTGGPTLAFRLPLAWPRLSLRS